MRITDLLRPEGIRLCAAPKGREEAIDLLITLQDRAGNLSDPARYKRDILARESQGSTAIGMEYGPRAEAGLLTSQRVIEEMFQDIVMNDTPVEEAAKAAEDKLNDLFSTLG